MLVIEPVLGSPTATPPPEPSPHTPDPVQHGLPTSLPPRPTLILTRQKHKEQQRWTAEPVRFRHGRAHDRAAALAGVTRDSIYI
jgi:hypothetical protein